MSADPYEVLGVDKNASKSDIKKAFRELSKKHHPDKGGDETEFKKISAAYEILSDEQKRAQFDQYGAAGMGGGGFGGGGFQQGDFGGFEDIFSNFFGGGAGGMGGGARRSSKTRGADLEVRVELSFEDMMKGVEKHFTSKNLEPCEKCDGEGGFDKKSCSTCSGTGAVSQAFQTPFGRVQQQTICPDCRGEGKTYEKRCSECQGEGRIRKKREVKVDIPAGVEDGETIRITGGGEAGIRGGVRGDLYVHVFVTPSKKFHRRGMDILTSLPVSVFDAISGGKFEVETFWGKVELTVPENTRDGQLLRIKSKGVCGSTRKGDHLVKIDYEMPKRVGGKLKKLLADAKKAGNSVF